MDLAGRGAAGRNLGTYNELCYLPDKVARFLFEFHAVNYQALQLPAIPSTASSGSIHKLLKTDHVIMACMATCAIFHNLLSKI